MLKPHNTQNIFKKVFNTLRLLGIGLFLFIVFRFDFNNVFTILAKSDIIYIIIGIGFQIVLLIGKGIRWHVMNNRTNHWKEWRTNLSQFYESYALGVITPGRLGEIVKVGHQKGKNNVIVAIFKVIAERGIDIGFFFIVAGLSIITGHVFVLPLILGWTFITIGFFILILGILLISSKGISLFINKVINFFPGKFKKIVLSYHKTTSRKMAIIILTSILSNISSFISCFFLALAVGLQEGGIIGISGIVAISGLFNMLPVSIMGLGTRELIFLYLFQPLEPSIILAFALSMVLIGQIVGGMIALITSRLLLVKS